MKKALWPSQHSAPGSLVWNIQLKLSPSVLVLQTGNWQEDGESHGPLPKPVVSATAKPPKRGGRSQPVSGSLGNFSPSPLHLFPRHEILAHCAFPGSCPNPNSLSLHYLGFLRRTSWDLPHKEVRVQRCLRGFLPVSFRTKRKSCTE